MSRSVRQWRHLRDLKRGAAGHSAVAINGLADGVLAIECPACPHPGRNLPPHWENVADDKAYVPFYPRTTNLDNLLDGYTAFSSQWMQTLGSS